MNENMANSLQRRVGPTAGELEAINILVCIQRFLMLGNARRMADKATLGKMEDSQRRTREGTRRDLRIAEAGGTACAAGCIRKSIRTQQRRKRSSRRRWTGRGKCGVTRVDRSAGGAGHQCRVAGPSRPQGWVLTRPGIGLVSRTRSVSYGAHASIGISVFMGVPRRWTS